MTLEILSLITGILFLSIMYIYSRLRNTEKINTLLVEQSLNNYTLIAYLIKALREKNVVTSEDLLNATLPDKENDESPR